VLRLPLRRRIRRRPARARCNPRHGSIVTPAGAGADVAAIAGADVPLSVEIVVALVVALLAVTALHADELQDLSSADVAPAVDAKDVSEPKANLGEGTGNFAGALMTSGSFTMMAANGGVEEELGEGEGTGNFAGALMTSGSFTMMAANGGV